MLNITCIKCDVELTIPGALIFSYPDSNGMVFKYHVCQNCWHSHLLSWMDDELVNREDVEKLALIIESIADSQTRITDENGADYARDFQEVAHSALTTYRQKYPKEEKK